MTRSARKRVFRGGTSSEFFNNICAQLTAGVDLERIEPWPDREPRRGGEDEAEQVVGFEFRLRVGHRLLGFRG
jgi:hypothetical protein